MFLVYFLEYFPLLHFFLKLCTLLLLAAPSSFFSVFMAARAVSDETFSEYCLDSRCDMQGSNFDASTEEPWMVNEQQVTIFHRGRACSFDLVELQARSIIILAGQATNIAWNSEASSTSQLHRQNHNSSELSVKRSLQKFLQQRKRRSSRASYVSK